MSSTRARKLALSLAISGLGFITSPARAEVLFRGDLETGDLEQWDYLLKEEGLSVVMDPVAEGKYAGKVTITDKELWDNGLNRVEVQHQPDDAYLTEGKDIYYGFSFYLPQKLTDDNHQILYWETTQTYQQVMQLAVEGERMRFATQKPGWKVHWEADGKATAGAWHRVVIHVKWSASAEDGQVDLWLDGEQVVTGGKAQTFLGTPAFVQHGILRDTISVVETLYFDDARAGTTLADVLMPASTGGGGTGSGGTGGTGGGTAGMSSGGGTAGMSSGGTPSGGSGGAPSAGTMSGGAPNGGAPPATAGSTPSNSAPADGSSCAFAPRSPERGVAALAGLLGLAALRRRRR